MCSFIAACSWWEDVLRVWSLYRCIVRLYKLILRWSKSISIFMFLRADFFWMNVCLQSTNDPFSMSFMKVFLSSLGIRIFAWFPLHWVPRQQRGSFPQLHIAQRAHEMQLNTCSEKKQMKPWVFHPIHLAGGGSLFQVRFATEKRWIFPNDWCHSQVDPGSQVGWKWFAAGVRSWSSHWSNFGVTKNQAIYNWAWEVFTAEQRTYKITGSWLKWL